MHGNFEVYPSHKYQIMCPYLNFIYFNGNVIYVGNMEQLSCPYLSISFKNILITQNQSAVGNVIQQINKKGLT